MRSTIIIDTSLFWTPTAFFLRPRRRRCGGASVPLRVCSSFREEFYLLNSVVVTRLTHTSLLPIPNYILYEETSLLRSFSFSFLPFYDS